MSPAAVLELEEPRGAHHAACKFQFSPFQRSILLSFFSWGLKSRGSLVQFLQTTAPLRRCVVNQLQWVRARSRESLKSLTQTFCQHPVLGFRPCPSLPSTVPGARTSSPSFCVHTHTTHKPLPQTLRFPFHLCDKSFVIAETTVGLWGHKWHFIPSKWHVCFLFSYFPCSG